MARDAAPAVRRNRRASLADTPERPYARGEGGGRPVPHHVRARYTLPAAAHLLAHQGRHVPGNQRQPLSVQRALPEMEWFDRASHADGCGRSLRPQLLRVMSRKLVKCPTCRREIDW